MSFRNQKNHHSLYIGFYVEVIKFSIVCYTVIKNYNTYLIIFQLTDIIDIRKNIYADSLVWARKEEFWI